MLISPLVFTYYACHRSLQPEISINECGWHCVHAQSHGLICESAAINYIYSEISAEHLHVWIMYWGKSSTLWFMHFLFSWESLCICNICYEANQIFINLSIILMMKYNFKWRHYFWKCFSNIYLSLFYPYIIK